MIAATAACLSGGAAAEPATSPSSETTSAFDIGFGVAVTNDYVFRGITNSDSSPAIQGYIEPSFGSAYLNVWSSNVDFGEDFRGAEIDVALGIRPVLGPVSFDLGYVHYFYAPEDTSPDYGELFGKASYEFPDLFTAATEVYFAPDYGQTGKTGTYVEGGLEIPLQHQFSLSAAVGYQFFEDPDAFEQLTWNAGVSYTWKAMKFDIRYWDTDLSGDECIVRSGFANGCDARIVGTISFDTTWSELKKFGRR